MKAKTREQMQNLPEVFHQRLASLRKTRGLTANAMAKLIGVPASTYREWEYGRGMKLLPLQKISQVLAISVTELATGAKPNWDKHLQDLEDLEIRIREIRLNLASLT